MSLTDILQTLLSILYKICQLVCTAVDIHTYVHICKFKNASGTWCEIDCSGVFVVGVDNTIALNLLILQIHPKKKGWCGWKTGDKCHYAVIFRSQLFVI